MCIKATALAHLPVSYQTMRRKLWMTSVSSRAQSHSATVLSQKPPSYVTCASKELRERRVGYAKTQSCLTGKSRQDMFTAVMRGLEAGSYQCVYRFRAGYLRLTSELAGSALGEARSPFLVGPLLPVVFFCQGVRSSKNYPHPMLQGRGLGRGWRGG